MIRHITDISHFKNGWFIGNFDPSIIKTKDFEVGIHFYPSGHKGDGHYHAKCTEINYLLEGKASFANSNIFLYPGTIWVVKPGEKSDVIFYSDSKIIVIKVPSNPSDKHYENNI